MKIFLVKAICDKLKRNAKVVFISLLMGIVFFSGYGSRAYCWDFLDVDIFYWVFSTLAQVSGTLLGLLAVSAFFLFDSFVKMIDKHLDYHRDCKTEIKGTDLLKKRISVLRERMKGIEGEPIEFLNKQEQNLEHMCNTFNFLIKDDDRRYKDLKNLRDYYIKIFIYAFFSLLVVLSYSISILPFSFFLVTNKSIAFIIIFLFGIIFPLLALVPLLSFIPGLRSLVTWHKEYENFIPTHQESVESVKESLTMLADTIKLLEDEYKKPNL